MIPNNREPSEVTRIRELLQEWDDGLVSQASFECGVSDKFSTALINSIQNNQEYSRIGFGCFDRGVIPKYYVVDVEIAVNGFWFKPRIKKTWYQRIMNIIYSNK